MGKQILAQVVDFRDLTPENKKEVMFYYKERLSSYSDLYTDIGEILLALKTDSNFYICVLLINKKPVGHIQFKYFIEKEAPVSGLKSLLDIECVFKANYKKNKKLDFTMGVKVPVTSLCPCSKEISAFGAHNQRSIINAKIKYPHEQIIWIEDLVAMIEGEASCPIYPLLKREDEKYVTEFAYNNPKFVEDILRDLVLSFRTLQSLVWFEIECENYESIHNHSAYASHVEFID